MHFRFYCGLRQDYVTFLAFDVKKFKFTHDLFIFYVTLTQVWAKFTFTSLNVHFLFNSIDFFADFC